MIRNTRLKRITLFVTLALITLLLPVVPGTFSTAEERPAQIAVIENQCYQDTAQREQVETGETVNPLKIANIRQTELAGSEEDPEQMGYKPEPGPETGLKLFTAISERRKSSFITSFEKDQQMIRDYVSSADRIAGVALNQAAVAPGVLDPGDR